MTIKILKFAGGIILYILMSLIAFFGFMLFLINSLHFLFNIGISIKTGVIIFVCFYIGVIGFGIFSLIKGYFKSKIFWTYIISIPCIIVIFFLFIFPQIILYTTKGKRLEFYKKIGIRNYNEIYRVKDEDNAKHLLKHEIPELPFLISIPLDKDFTEEVFTDTFHNKISPYISLLDSFANYEYLQTINPQNYLSFIPYQFSSKIFLNPYRLIKYAYIDALYYVRKKDYKTALDIMSKLSHLGKILSRDLSINSKLISIIAYKTVTIFLLQGIEEGWGKNDEFGEMIRRTIKDCDSLNFMIPAKIVKKDGKIFQISGMNLGIFLLFKNLNDMMKWQVSFPWKLYNLNLFDFIICLSLSPTSYDEFFNYANILLPKTFDNKEKYAKWYIQNQDYINSYMSKYINISYISLGILLLNYPAFYRREIELIALKNILYTAYKIENAKSKEYPESIPDIPLDPFSGEPLKYKKLGKGYIIYSVGQNGKDEGGESGDDIVFEKGIKMKGK